MTSLPRNYIRRPDGGIEPCDDLKTFTAWINQKENRIVARTAIPYGDFKEAIIVDTVFFGYDYSIGAEEPIFFETKANFPDGQVFIHHYATEKEAKAGHLEVIKEVQSVLDHEDRCSNFLLPRTFQKNQSSSNRRRIKDPPTKTPKKQCRRCQGTGIDSESLLPNTKCDCVISRRHLR